jgi:hypothetical protein
MASRIWTRLLLVVSVSCLVVVVPTRLEVTIGLLDQNLRIVSTSRAVALSLSNGLGCVEGDLAFKRNSVPCTEELESFVWVYCGFNSGVMGWEDVLPVGGPVGGQLALGGRTWFCMDSSVPVWPDNKSCRPKGSFDSVWCALFRFVVPVVLANSLLVYRCVSLSFKVYASTSHTTLEGVLRGGVFVLLLVFFWAPFTAQFFLAGDHMETAQCGAPTRWPPTGKNCPIAKSNDKTLSCSMTLSK